MLRETAQKTHVKQQIRRLTRTYVEARKLLGDYRRDHGIASGTSQQPLVHGLLHS
jgi:hypothetical protein